MEDIYKPLTSEEAADLDLEIPSSKDANLFVSSFLRHCMPNLKKTTPEEFLERKAINLKHDYKRKKQTRKKSKKMSAQEQRQMALFQIKPEEQRYENFLPLHELWKQYIRELCNGLKPDTKPDLIQNKLLRADLHGALIMVSRSKCPSYVGITGIIIQETKYVFRLITKADKLKIIPKANSIFTVELDGFTTYFYGNNLQTTASERSVKKFKAGRSIDL